MNVGVVGLGAEGVDFTTHLLSDEAEFLAGAFLVYALLEVVAMLAQANLFFSDIEFFEIENQFLLEAVFVILAACELLQVLDKAAFNHLVAVFLERLHLAQISENQFDAFQKVFLKYSTFLGSEIISDFKGFLQCSHDGGHKVVVIFLLR